MQIAADLVETETRRKKLYETLDKISQHKNRYEHLRMIYYDRAETIRLSVVNRLDDQDAQLAFLNAHLQREHFREKLVRYHLEHNNLGKARRLCKEWLDNPESTQNRYYPLFQDLLLTIAQHENQHEEINYLAEELFLATGEFKYYVLLKDTLSTEEWPETRTRLITRTKQQDTQFNDLRAEIYVREEMWSSLFEMIQDAHRRTVDRYREHLEQHFPEKVCGIYERIIWEIMEERVNRKGYQEGCRYLRRIKKMGQIEFAHTLIDALKAKYSNRPALLDELSRV